MARLSLGDFGNAIAEPQNYGVINVTEGLLEGTRNIINDQAQHLEDVKRAQALELNADVENYKNERMKHMTLADEDIMKGNISAEEYQSKLDEMADPLRQSLQTKWADTAFGEEIKNQLSVRDSAIGEKAFEKEREHVVTKTLTGIQENVDALDISQDDVTTKMEKLNNLLLHAPMSADKKQAYMENKKQAWTTGHWDLTVVNAVRDSDMSSLDNVENKLKNNEIPINEDKKATLQRSINAARNSIESNLRAGEAKIGNGIKEAQQLIIEGDLVTAGKSTEKLSSVLPEDKQQSLNSTKTALRISTDIQKEGSQGKAHNIEDYLTEEEKIYYKDKPLELKDAESLVNSFSANDQFKREVYPLSISNNAPELYNENGVDASALNERVALVQNNGMGKGVFVDEVESANSRAAFSQDPRNAIDFFTKLNATIDGKAGAGEIISDTVSQLLIEKGADKKTIAGKRGWMASMAVAKNPATRELIASGASILNSGAEVKFPTKIKTASGTELSFSTEDVSTYLSSVIGLPDFGTNSLLEHDVMANGLRAYLVGSAYADGTAIKDGAFDETWVKSRTDEFLRNTVGKPFSFNDNPTKTFIDPSIPDSMFADSMYQEYKKQGGTLTSGGFKDNVILNNTKDPEVFSARFKTDFFGANTKPILLKYKPVVYDNSSWLSSSTQDVNSLD